MLHPSRNDPEDGMSSSKLLEDLQANISQELHVGAWLEITQQRIDRFARVTGDDQWIHTNPERAALESPYGSTVAHGFLTLSLLPYLTQTNHPDYFKLNFPGMSHRINYGLNKVRFPAPVKAGARIRARTQLQSAEMVGAVVDIVYRMTIEIAGEAKPACVAEQVFRIFP
jgi:acyl dehydratase